ncbi:hypothetical protein CHS0354_014898 [Potamilus streckersoni]|uniref:Uncharacterized protein n=1 Tax=Potamilus streckersoni TaxID=2493646 RepID=A0AAE0SB34_9BIVA|nr:hypothetical protein CHS0354_014898 [Potamilus streckersoni]
MQRITADYLLADLEQLVSKTNRHLGNPVVDSDAETNKYADDQESKYVLVSGGIMHSFLNLNNNGIKNLRAPDLDDATENTYMIKNSNNELFSSK